MIRHYSTTRDKRKARIRKKISGTQERPRLTVFRSNKSIYAQFVDDQKRVTLFGSDDKKLNTAEKNKIKRAFELGKLLAEEAKKQSITTIIFDRSGYTYHGRVKALAEGLREGGIVF